MKNLETDCFMFDQNFKFKAMSSVDWILNILNVGCAHSTHIFIGFWIIITANLVPISFKQKKKKISRSQTHGRKFNVILNLNHLFCNRVFIFYCLHCEVRSRLMSVTTFCSKWKVFQVSFEWKFSVLAWNWYSIWYIHLDVSTVIEWEWHEAIDNTYTGVTSFEF